jgi:protein O-GlcNAc transferase
MRLATLRLLFFYLWLALAGQLGSGSPRRSGQTTADGRVEDGACGGLARHELNNFDRLLERTAELAQVRNLDAAQECLKTALGVAKNEHQRAHVYFNLAVLSRQRGDVNGAKSMLLKAPKKGIKKWAQAHLFLGTLQNESGESRKALASLTRAMKLSPQDPAVYREMAQCYYNLGEAPSAVHVWGEGVVNMPTSSEGFFNLGLLMRELGGKHAERCYKTALRLQPDSARYRYSFGNLLYDRHRLTAAASVYAAALRLDPTHEDALNNLGNALRQSGQLDGARHAFEHGLARNPHNTNLLLNAGQVYQDLGLLDETARVAEEAFRLNPGLIEASILRGSVAYGRGVLHDAIRHYRTALEIDPAAQQPLLNLANTLGDQYRGMEARIANQHDGAREEMRALQRESIEVYERMLALRPDDAEAFLNMIWARKYACDWADWEGNMERLQAMVKAQLDAHKAPSLKPFLALAFPIPASLYLRIAAAHAHEESKKAASLRRVLARVLEPHALGLLAPLAGSPRPRLRLAYVSTDLGDHPVGHQAWFHHHSPERFDVVLLALSADDGSEWWQRNKAMVPPGNFHELGKLGADISAAAFARYTNALGVHILVTLNGWTSGHQLEAFALMPAPLQVEYMGSHDSTGADFVNLFVSDRVASPPDYAAFYAEKLLVTPDSFFINEYRISRSHVPPLADAVYSGRRPPPDADPSDAEDAHVGRVTREGYGLPRSGVIMCNFNQLFKVHPTVLLAKP